MVGHDLQGQGLGLEIGGRLVDDPDEPIADRADQDLAAPLGTPDQVIVDEFYCTRTLYRRIFNGAN
jgi:hypothetical protein